METNQPTSTTVYVQQPTTPTPGLFGSKVPSVSAFIVAILLFLMPFVDIKCNGTSLKTFTGLKLATGYDTNFKENQGGLLDDIQEKSVDVTSKATDKKKTSLFMLVALLAGGAGLLLSFTNSKALLGLALVAGLAGGGSLIAGMLDIKKEAKTEMNLKDKVPDSKVGDTVEKIGDKMSDLTNNIKITVDFTPWFYIAVIAFLAAAFFSYRRMSARK